MLQVHTIAPRFDSSRQSIDMYGVSPSFPTQNQDVTAQLPPYSMPQDMSSHSVIPSSHQTPQASTLPITAVQPQSTSTSPPNRQLMSALPVTQSANSPLSHDNDVDSSSPAEQPPSAAGSTASSSSSTTGSDSSQQSVAHSHGSSANTSPPIVQFRSLAQITELSSAESIVNATSTSGRHRTSNRSRERLKYEISSMPVTDIIEMVAQLLSKITTTNDRQHDQMHRPFDANPALGSQSSSVLAFHGKNIPSITILSYLSRIHKYCPTTYEVFLSLLVYFDRMTERHNPRTNPPTPVDGVANDPQYPPQYFVVDSFNIHRLVIAGVTCASKFFSDVFYTNSRYAKVGGLPLVELNHLELQFLILNDFRLAIPVEELEAYGTMLVQFYARETLAKAAADAPPV